MKTLSKIVMVGAVAAVAIAMSAAPSDARGKRHGKKMSAIFPVAACMPGVSCSGPPNALQEGRSVVYWCGGDGKWVAGLNPGCMGPGCPPPCGAR